MKKFITAVVIIAATITSSMAYANPWEIKEGSTLLDGKETASRVSGHMFSGKEYEYTSSQMLLVCEEGALQMEVAGDGPMLTREQFAANPTLDIMVKAGSDVETFSVSVSSKYNLEIARIHDGPRLLALLRNNDGDTVKAQVQLPVARTGVPEVRSLSLENVVSTTDVIIATCGPLGMWTPDGPVAEVKDEEPALDLTKGLSVGVAQEIVEVLILEKGITIEAIVEALKPLGD